jgi:ADP-ribosylglycohydrolase
MNKPILRRLFTGLAMGDALGATSEFASSTEVSKLYSRYKEAGWPFMPVGGGGFSWRPGQPTDDTEMALWLIRWWVESPSHYASDLYNAFVVWAKSARDVGGQTWRVLSRPPLKVTGAEGFLPAMIDWWEHQGEGNGALMRNGVVSGLDYHPGGACALAVKHTRVTHAGPDSVVASLTHASLIHTLLTDNVAFAGDRPRQPDHQPSLIRGVFDNVRRSSALPRSVYVGVDYSAALRRAEELPWETFNPYTYLSEHWGYCWTTLLVAYWALRQYWEINDGREGDIRHDDPAVAPAFAPETRLTTYLGQLVLGRLALVGRDADTYGAVAGPMLAAAGAQFDPAAVEKLEALSEFDRIVGKD